MEIGLIHNDRIEEFRVVKSLTEPILGNTVFIELNQKLFTAVQDLSENTVLLIDEYNDPYESYRFSVFGKEAASNTKNNPWRFSSKRKDPETGFVFFDKRFYDPKNGQWITKDLEKCISEEYPYGFFKNSPFLNATNTNNSLLPKSIDRTYTDPENSPLFFEEQKQSPFGIRNDQFHIGNQGANHASSWDKNFSKYDGSSPYSNSSKNTLTLAPYREYKGEKPATYTLDGKEIQDISFGYINGIRTNLGECLDHGMHIQKLLNNVKIHCTHNPNLGLFGGLAQSIAGIFRAEVPSEIALRKSWENRIENLGENGICIELCTSQGAIHAKNALSRTPEELRQRISLVSIEPAVRITPGTSRNAVNICNDSPFKDVVPYFDIIGIFKSRTNSRYVSSHKEAPAFDHSVTSPTYEKPIAEEVEILLNKEGRSLYNK